MKQKKLHIFQMDIWRVHYEHRACKTFRKSKTAADHSKTTNWHR